MKPSLVRFDMGRFTFCEDYETMVEIFTKRCNKNENTHHTRAVHFMSVYFRLGVILRKQIRYID